MKKGIIKTIVSMMVTASILTGCASHRDLVQEDEVEIEKTVEDVSETATQEEIEENVKEVLYKKAEVYIPPQTTPGEYASAVLMEGEELSEEELQQLQFFFSSVENYGFTLSSYETPDGIDWYEVFNCEGAGIANCEFSKEALYEFMDIKGYDHEAMYIASEDRYEGLSAISGKDVKAFVEAKTGITDFDLNRINFYTYIEREDVLFRFADPFIYDDEITCLQGVKNDDRIQVVIGFSDKTRLNRRITLEKTGDLENPYRFCSNRQLWEESADEIIGVKDYETDEILACSVNNKSNGVILKPVRDNIVCGYAKALINETDSREFSYIVEAALRDVDGDGLKDTIAILSFGDDIIPIVCLGDHESWGVIYCAEAKNDVTEWLIDNVSDITADNVIKYILEHQEEFDDVG